MNNKNHIVTPDNPKYIGHTNTKRKPEHINKKKPKK